MLSDENKASIYYQSAMNKLSTYSVHNYHINSSNEVIDLIDKMYYEWYNDAKNNINENSIFEIMDFLSVIQDEVEEIITKLDENVNAFGFDEKSGLYQFIEYNNMLFFNRDLVYLQKAIVKIYDNIYIIIKNNNIENTMRDVKEYYTDIKYSKHILMYLTYTSCMIYYSYDENKKKKYVSGLKKEEKLAMLKIYDELVEERVNNYFFENKYMFFHDNLHIDRRFKEPIEEENKKQEEKERKISVIIYIIIIVLAIIGFIVK